MIPNKNLLKLTYIHSDILMNMDILLDHVKGLFSSVLLRRVLLVLAIWMSVSWAYASTPPAVSGTWNSADLGDFNGDEVTWFDIAAINGSAALFVGKVEPSGGGSTYAALGHYTSGRMEDINSNTVYYDKILRGVDYSGSVSSGDAKAIAVGEGGVVYRLDHTAAGANWTLSSLSKPATWTTGYVYAVDILDSNDDYIWFAGNSGFVGQHTQGGVNDNAASSTDWGSVTISTPNWYGIHAFSETSAIVVGDGGQARYIISYSAGGAASTRTLSLPSVSGNTLYSVDFYDDDHGVIGGANGVLYITDTGGSTSAAWTEISDLRIGTGGFSTVTERTIYSVSRPTKDIIFVAGYQESLIAFSTSKTAFFRVGILDEDTGDWTFSSIPNADSLQGYVRAMDMYSTTAGFAGSGSALGASFPENYAYDYDGTEVREYYNSGSIDLSIGADSNDAILSWNESAIDPLDTVYSSVELRRAVSADLLEDGGTYTVVASADLDIPDLVTDNNVLNDGISYCYRLHILNGDGQSYASSNIVCIQSYDEALVYDETASYNYDLISVPYNASYADGQALYAALNNDKLSSGPVSMVQRWNPDTQAWESVFYRSSLGYLGTNFTVVPGEAIMVELRSSANVMALVGEYTPGFEFNLNYDAALSSNYHTISLPPDATYPDAQALYADINGGALGTGAVVTLQRWNSTTAQWESQFYVPGIGYLGINFSRVPGEGYFISIQSDVSAWTPEISE